jgi:hypothetical protein
MEVGGRHHATTALPRGESVGTHRTGGWVGPRSGLDRPLIGILVKVFISLLAAMI